ncbi:hypothetical protein IGS59_05410 [Janthinobacterium sp. GW460P]|uniref:hypothetical protein n=1 Tax=unclassified Janthinobacterium TaxID=2610881 RepID=UPI001C0AA11E|nr:MULTISPECIES: hypothetical protein [unclassified Janthinobacterium]MCC7701669.1 hypothetical protein [Janthinobacterium sp. GW460P]
MTFKEYHQNSHKEHALAKNMCNCEIIYVYREINFRGEFIAADGQGERVIELACAKVFL